MNLPFFIARRYLVKQKGAFSSFIIRLAIVATALSVAVMIVALAVVTGFNDAITQKLYGFMGHVHIVPFDETKSNALSFSDPVYKDAMLMVAVKQIPHVAGCWAFAERPIIVQRNGQMEGLKIKGVTSDYHFMEGVSLTGGNIDFADSQYSKQILLSQTTANRLNVRIGDSVQLNFFVGDGLPRIRKVMVSGLFHSGMDEVDKIFAVCDLRMLQRVNNWPADSVNGYQVDLDNATYADTVANYIHSNLILPPLEAYTTTENYSFIFEWLQLQRVNGVILLVIMAAVAIINMGAVLVILMVDRAMMIGLLKALGMTYEDTRSIFLAIAALIGAAGVLLGNIVAFVICWAQLRFGFIKLPEDIYYMRYAPIKIVWWQVGLIDVITLLLCVLCMWIPALYIRRIQPAKVLQFK